jgi:hypothetical protein
MVTSERRMDGEGELGTSMESNLTAAEGMGVESKERAMFCLVEERRGFRFARFSGKRNALSESFFFVATGLKRKVFPMMPGEALGEQETNGPWARRRRVPGLG